MIFKFETFVLESYNSKAPSSFFLLVGIAVFKPELLSFVSNIRNKYTLTASEVNQSILIEIKTNKNIVFNNININTASVLTNIEADWSLIKKAAESAKQIRDNFNDIKTVIVSTSHIEIETEENSISVNRDKKNQISSKELLNSLEINELDIYKNENWENFVSEWCTLLKASVKQDYSRIIDTILEHKKITWGLFSRKRNDTIGIKVQDLPRLYYNNLFDLSKDLAYNQEAFINYNSFIKKWISIKKNVFLDKIIVPFIQSKLEQMTKDKSIMGFFDNLLNFNQEQNNHSFKLSNSGMLIKNVHSNIKSEKVEFKLLVNRKSDLIIILTNGVDTIKLLFGTSQIFPSKIKITSRNNG